MCRLGLSRRRSSCYSNLGISIETRVSGLHQLAEIMLGNRNWRVFLRSACAALEAADHRVWIGILEEHQRDAVARHGLHGRNAYAVQGGDPAIVRPPHQKIADVAAKAVARNMHVDPVAPAMLHLQAARHVIAAQESHCAVVSVSTGAK